MFILSILLAAFGVVGNGYLLLTAENKTDEDVTKIAMAAAGGAAVLAAVVDNSTFTSFALLTAAVSAIYAGGYIVLQHKAPHLTKPKPKAVDAPLPEPDPNALPPAEKPIYPKLPEEHRTAHTMIIGKSQSGKTTALGSLILDDFEKPNATVVVFDSEGVLINNLLNAAPSDRVVYFSPEQDLAMNPFAAKDPQLFEYIFAEAGQELTPNMRTVYRNVAKLVMAIPGGNLMTMWRILQGGSTPYQPQIDTLGEVERAFFATQFEGNRSYRETKDAILTRFNTLLENEKLRDMFCASTNKVNLSAEIAAGKIILIHPSTRILNTTSSIFARFFMAQLNRDIMSQEDPYDRRLYVYADEFSDYTTSRAELEELFEKAAKRNVALTVGFQGIYQLKGDLKNAVLLNTGTKMMGRSYPEDQSYMAKELQVDVEQLMALQKGQFATKVPEERAYTFKAPKDRLRNVRPRDDRRILELKRRMQEQYGVSPADTSPPQDAEQASPPAPPKLKDPFAGVEG